MIGAKTRVATRIKEIEPHVHLSYCHGHALQLAVGDTIKGTLMQISKLSGVFVLI